MNKNQRELKAVEAELSKVALEAKSLRDGAAKEDRDLTDEENSQVEELFTKSEALKEKKNSALDAIALDEQISELGRNIAVKSDEADREVEARQAKSIGEQFVESKNYKLAAAQGGSALKSVEGFEVKATLSETEGGAGLLTPQYQPGVLPKLFQRLTIADLLADGTTDSPTVTYIKESTANLSAITAVAEGAEKPEVELGYEQVSASVKKIAGFFTVTDEMLEDASQLSSYINGRLSLGVKIAEEKELLEGTGTGAHIKGILPSLPSGNKAVKATAISGQNMADNIFAGLTKVRSFFIEPDGIIVNPEDWYNLRLTKDKNNNYVAGSPFSNTGSNPGDSLFGLPVVVTAAMTAGSALVGSFQTSAQIFRKAGLTVETTNSHASYFRTNLTAIRAEERLALAVYRPEGFATVNTAAVS